MKKLLTAIIMAASLIANQVQGATTLVPDMTEDTTPGSDSLVYTVDDPAGTPADRKTTVGNLIKGMAAANLSIVDSGNIMTATEVEGALQENRTAIDLNTAKEAFAPVSQSETLGDNGTLTPTASPLVTVLLTCSVDDAGILLGESLATHLDIVVINNVGANSCIFADSAAVLELPSTITLEQDNALFLQYRTDRWVSIAYSVDNLPLKWINLGAGTIQGALDITASGTEVTIADATSMNKIYKISAAVDVNIPTGMCDTATGMWLTVKANGANVVSIRSLDASNKFELSNGTQTTAGDELDTAGADGSTCTVVCDEAEVWTVYGEVGTCADGGAGD